MAEQHQLPTPKQPPAEIEADAPTYDTGNNVGDESNLRPAVNKIEVETTSEGETSKPEDWKDEKRNAIFARNKKSRAEQMQDFSGDPNDPDARYGKVDQSDLGDLEREALERRKQYQREQFGQQDEPPQQPQQPQQQTAAPASANPALDLNSLPPELRNMEFNLRIDGRNEPITLDSLLRDAQISRATSKRYDLVKQMLAQVQEMHRLAQPAAGAPEARGQQPRGDNPFDGPDGGDTSHQQNRPDVKALVEKIQLGSVDEAAEALTTFLENSQRSQPQVDDTTRVLSVLEDRNAEEAIVKFAEKHPEIADPDLQSLMTRNLILIQGNDLENAGYDQEWLRQNIRSVDELKQFHKMLRARRVPGIRSTGECLEIALNAAKQKASAWAGTPAAPAPAPRQQGTPPSGMAARLERKAALPAQPAQRRAAPPPANQNKTVEQSRSRAVAEMQKRRGQAHG